MSPDECEVVLGRSDVLLERATALLTLGPGSEAMSVRTDGERVRLIGELSISLMAMERLLDVVAERITATGNSSVGVQSYARSAGWTHQDGRGNVNHET